MERFPWKQIVGLTLIAGLLGLGLSRVEFWQPVYLVLFGLVPVFVWIGRCSRAGLPRHTRLLSAVFRSVAVIAIALVLAGMQVESRNRRLAVFFLIDNSESIPGQLRERQLEYVRNALQEKGRDDLAGIIVFGAQPSLEIGLSRDPQIDILHSVVEENLTNLEAAVDLAVAAFPDGVRRKIVLLTDGNQNTGNALAAIRQGSGDGVEVDVLPLERLVDNEVMAEHLRTPQTVHRDEPFSLSFQLSSTTACDAEIRLLREGELVTRQAVRLKAGRNHFEQDFILREPGFARFTAEVVSSADSIPANNGVQACVEVRGEPGILLVAPAGNADAELLTGICTENSIVVNRIEPEFFPHRLEQIAQHDLLILANTPARLLTQPQMELIHVAVHELGMGLLMLGGEQSFGVGGYKDTPVEKALPVNMDLRNKKVLPEGALVMILDKSGSMGGKPMTLAQKAAKTVIRSLGSHNRVGIVAFDGQPQLLCELTSCSRIVYLEKLIDSIESGGGTQMYPAMKTGWDLLKHSEAHPKHMLIVSDGQCEQADFRKLAVQIARTGGSVSCISINPDKRLDTRRLELVARLTGGRFYDIQSAEELPNLFLREAEYVRRSIIFRKPFMPQLSASSELTRHLTQGTMPALDAYVASSAKNRAVVSMVSVNENRDPILAQWRYGLGRAVAFTSSMAPDWGGDWRQSPPANGFWLRLLRWTARPDSTDGVVLNCTRDGNKTRVTIDAVDHEGHFMRLDQVIGRSVNEKGESSPVSFTQTAPGRYQGSFETGRPGFHFVSAAYTDATGQTGFVQTPVLVPQSPELRTIRSNLRLLRRIIKLADLEQRFLRFGLEQSVFQSALPPAVTLHNPMELLLMIAILCFFADVFVRRVSLDKADLRQAWAWMRGERGESERDEMFERLLSKKNRNANRVDAGFPERLHENAAAETETELPNTAPASSEPIRQQTQKTRPIPFSHEPEDEYMGRLLNAKKRFRSNEASEEDSG